MDLTLLTLATVVILTGFSMGLHALGVIDATPLLAGLGAAISALAFKIRSERKRKRETAVPEPVKSPTILPIVILLLAPMLTHCAAGSADRWKTAGSAYGSCLMAAALQCAPALYPPPAPTGAALALPNPPPKCKTTPDASEPPSSEAPTTTGETP